MANEKKYEMLFALNARMNGGFSGAFSKAQAEFARLGKEVQGLHRVQGDIASYQKQQRAVEATKGKLESLQKQHDLLQKEIGETTGSTTGLEREEEKLAQRIKDAETALERQKQKLDATGAKLKDAGVDTSNLAQKDAELTAKIKELEAAQEKAAEGAASFGERSAQAVGAVQQAIAAAGIAVALKEIADAFMECVGVAGDFEETMSTVEALSQANSREMAALSEQAKELGATTKFTAQQAGDAMGYMAMAGWDANEMLQGMDGVLQLAAASGEDLAMVSDIVTDSLSAFGLTAADTAHFSDVLAAAATNSNTNVAIMGETFKMSASVAGALGYSIEDVAVAMGLMANSGVKGSIAGTALRNTFNGLLEGVTLTGAAFGEYEYSAVKADGTMKDFGSTIDELRGCFEQMTEAERVSNAMTIAGKRGYNGLLAILNATEEDYTSLTGSINDCTGAAQRMANVKLDNMNGQLTLMNSAWDALKTTIGEEFIPEARGLYALGTDIFTGLNEFVKANPAVVRGVMATVGALGAGVAVLTGIATVTKVLIPLMGTLTAAIPGVNIIMGVTAAVAGIVGVVTALATAANAGVPSVKELTEATRKMREAMDEASASFEQTASKTLATASVADTYIDKLEEIEAATDGNVEGNQEYHNILTLLTRAIPELADSIDLETNSIEGGTEALRANAQAWEDNAKAQAYQEYMNSLMDEYNTVMVDAAEKEIKLTEAQIKAERASEGVRTTYQKLLSALGMTEEQFKRTYNSVADIPYRAVSEEVATLRGEYLDYQRQLSQAERTQYNLQEAIQDSSEAVTEAETVLDGAQAAYERLTGVTEAQAAAEAEVARQSLELQGVIDGTTEELAALTEAYNEAYAAAFDSIHGQYALWDEAAEVVAVSAGSINSNLEGQAAYWRDYNANLQALSERSADIAGLGDVIASFADGSAESVNAIAGLADAAMSSDDDLRKLVDNWAEVHKEQKAASDAIAQFVVDIPGQMQELEDAMREGIEALEFSDEAAQGARDTIQGFIDGANNMLPQVQAAYRQLAQAAKDAINIQVSISNPDPVEHSMDWARPYMTPWAKPHAEGGILYQPHIGLVAEDGPEAVIPLSAGRRGRGIKLWQETGQMMGLLAKENAFATSAGEARLAAAFGPQVSGYPEALAASPIAAPVSAQPAEHLGGTSSPAPVSIQVAFQIEGNATPEVVEQLRTYGNEFAERVLEVMEEYGIDTARKAYT